MTTNGNAASELSTPLEVAQKFLANARAVSEQPIDPTDILTQQRAGQMQSSFLAAAAAATVSIAESLDALVARFCDGEKPGAFTPGHVFEV